MFKEIYSETENLFNNFVTIKANILFLQTSPTIRTAVLSFWQNMIGGADVCLLPSRAPAS